ncbi:MAG: DUF4118 domain-containing protein [Flavobacteriales bacterium]|nr:DUF4118 domain-containing protein [Flavobacteriales bacterium]MBP6697773.1 DUF4118 domain-containing protein [Flavobacteriales bacterium]
MQFTSSLRREYGAALVAVSLAVIVRAAMDPVLGDHLPYYIFYFAVIASVTVGGIGPGLIALIAGFLVASYFFAAPRYSLGLLNEEDLFGGFRFLSLGAVMVLAGGWARAHLIKWKLEASRRREEEAAARQALEHTHNTLASIGDGLITTDTAGRVTFINQMAQELSGWTNEEAVGQNVDQVFRIVNIHSREPVPNPALHALRHGTIMTIPEQTSLVHRQGLDQLIDDSAAPIRDNANNIIGSVIVFRKLAVKEDRFTIQGFQFHPSDGAQLPLSLGDQQRLERSCRTWLYREWIPSASVVRFATLNGYDLIVREEVSEQLPSGALGIRFQVGYARVSASA